MEEQTLSNQTREPQTPPVVQPTAPVTKPDNKKMMGILAYLGILIIIPILMAKDDAFVNFHIKQGLLLVIVEIVTWFIGSMMWQNAMLFIINLVNLAVLVFAIIGIVNVVKGNQKELPVIGSYAKNFTF